MKIVRRGEKIKGSRGSLLIFWYMKIRRVEQGRNLHPGTIVSLLIRFKTRPRPSVCIVRKHENRYSQWNLVTVVPLAWSRLSVTLREHTHSHCQTTNCPGSKLWSLTTDRLHDLPLALTACCGHLFLLGRHPYFATRFLLVFLRLLRIHLRVSSLIVDRNFYYYYYCYYFFLLSFSLRHSLEAKIAITFECNSECMANMFALHPLGRILPSPSIVSIVVQTFPESRSSCWPHEISSWKAIRWPRNRPIPFSNLFSSDYGRYPVYLNQWRINAINDFIHEREKGDTEKWS